LAMPARAFSRPSQSVSKSTIEKHRRLDPSTTKNNLSLTLSRLGEREKSPGQFIQEMLFTCYIGSVVSVPFSRSLHRFSFGA
jgi:hypothetical protein